MQNTEPDGHAGEPDPGQHKSRDQGNEDGNEQELSAASPVAVGQAAADAAEQDEDAGEPGFRRGKEGKEAGARCPAEAVRHEDKGVVKDHAEHAESAKIIHQADTPLSGRRGRSCFHTSSSFFIWYIVADYNKYGYN